MCGIIGVWESRQAAQVVRQALPSLQHRGQDSAGIVGTTRDSRLKRIVRMGLAANGFDPQLLDELDGSRAIGHTRYATTGEQSEANMGPLLHDSPRGPIGIAHNGNLVNYKALRQAHERCGVTFKSTTDTETIVHGYALSAATTDEEAIFHSLTQVDGAYSVVVMTQHVMVAGRDPRGMRPLVFGRLHEGYIVASETCTLNQLGASAVREVAPGEMLVFTAQGVSSYRPFPAKPTRLCVFERIYLGRPDSSSNGQSMQTFRIQLGHILAQECPPPSHLGSYLVVPVPNSGNAVAYGYAAALGGQVSHALIKNPGVQRTFIAPDQQERERLADQKYSVIGDMVDGQNVIIVDDSLVRGTTAHRLTQKLRNVGARSVHWRIGSPRLVNRCHYGIHMPTRRELLASRFSNEQITEMIGADSIGYLGLEALEAKASANEHCMACFAGRYPTPLPDTAGDLIQVGA